MSFLRFSAPPLPHFVAIGEDTYEPGDKHPSRRNVEVFDLLVVTRGRLFMGEENNEWTVVAGQALVLRPDRHHFASQPCKEQTHFYWLHFQTTGQWSEVSEQVHPAGSRSPIHGQGLSDLSDSTAFPDFYDKATPYGRLSAFLMKMFPIRIPRLSNLAHASRTLENLRRIHDLAQHPLPSARWKQQILFQEVIQDLLDVQMQNHETAAIQLAEQAAKFLRENYRSDINYERLRDNLNFHPTYIARCMRLVFHCSPLEYLVRYRIEQAKLLLMNSDMSIQTAAQEVGFHHFSYFCRTFVKIEGVSPGVFRKRYRT